MWCCGIVSSIMCDDSKVWDKLKWKTNSLQPLCSSSIPYDICNMEGVIDQSVFIRQLKQITITNSIDDRNQIILHLIGTKRNSPYSPHISSNRSLKMMRDERWKIEINLKLISTHIINNNNNKNHIEKHDTDKLWWQKICQCGWLLNITRYAQGIFFFFFPNLLSTVKSFNNIGLSLAEMLDSGVKLRWNWNPL